MGRNATLTLPEGVSEQESIEEMQRLRELTLELREAHYPPTISDGLVAVDTDLPIWVGGKEAVREYHMKFKEAFDVAHKYYPQAALQKDYMLPAKLMLPLFKYDVVKLSICKNKAKESKTYGSVGAVVDKCGEFEYRDIARMKDFFDDNPLGSLVCHREFVDYRARMHTFNVRSNKMDKKSFITQFYTTGLIISAHDIDNLQVVDNRQRKQRSYSNAYTNPIANNGTWKVYPKKPSTKKSGSKKK